ncbi:MAG: hypothetical protein ACM31C_02480 [Acidobacteriota bacterium]
MIGRALALAGDELAELLGGPLGEQARAARRELARADKRTRALWLAEARVPVPPGFRGVHPSWIEAALAELPARARAALAAGGGDEIDVWLARWACAAIPPLPQIARAFAPPRSPGDVIALPDPAAWLAAVGREQRAYAVSLARDRAPRRDELGAPRAVIARCQHGDDLAIGARAFAPYTSPLARRQLVVRLPRDVGARVDAELRSHERDSLAEAPSWTALATARGAG